MQPSDVARFLIFDNRLPRSIAFCASEMRRMISQLRSEFRLRNAQRAFEHADALLSRLQAHSRDEQLITRLHDFNDWVQTELMKLTAELASTFFGHQPVAPEPPKPTQPSLDTSLVFQSQAQTSGQFQTQG
jgi:uncharacterized alpha-E superfamily protein